MTNANREMKMFAKTVGIFLEPRPDGGLRVYSDDLPGLILSGPDPEKVMGAVLTAINILQSYNETAKALP